MHILYVLLHIELNLQNTVLRRKREGECQTLKRLFKVQKRYTYARFIGKSVSFILAGVQTKRREEESLCLKSLIFYISKTD